MIGRSGGPSIFLITDGILSFMSDSFDVYVVGASDPSQAGVAKLAALIANRHGAPVAAVTNAITAGSLRAGKGLTAGAADQLAQQLNALGAVTDIRPASAPAAAPAAGPATIAGPRTSLGGFAPSATGGLGLKPLTSAAPFSPPTRADAHTPTAIGPGAMAPLTPLPSPYAPPPAASSASAFAPSAFAPPNTGAPPSPFAPSGAPPAMVGHDPFAPPGTGAGPSPFAPPGAGAGPSPFAPPGTGAGPSPFAPPPSRPAQSAFAPPAAAPPASTATAPASPFGDPDGDQETPLQLDRSSRPQARPASQAVAAPAGSLPGASAINVRLDATSSSSHMHVEEGTGNLASVRCPRHGLYFDKNKASGCRKCLEGARARASEFEAKAVGFRLAGYRDNPAKRAFTGLLFALILGLLPAAFHALGPGAAEVKRLRLEQEELSRRTGTEEVLRRFDEVDDQVVASRRQAIRVTAGIWIAVTAGVMAAWYRIT